MGIRNYTEISVTGFDKIRVLFGRKIKLYTDIETAENVDVLGTTQSCIVDRFFESKPKGALSKGLMFNGDATNA